MARRHGYEAVLTWTGAAAAAPFTYDEYARAYEVAIPGKPILRGSADPLFRGDPAVHNPEDLLIAALAGCHMLSYLALAARAGIAVLGYRDRATATMELHGGGGRFVEALLRPEVTVAAGADLTATRELHDAAHARCFIANSVNFPVRHEATVEAAG